MPASATRVLGGWAPGFLPQLGAASLLQTPPTSANPDPQLLTNQIHDGKAWDCVMGEVRHNDACHFWVPLLDHDEGICPACPVRSSATPRRTGQPQTPKRELQTPSPLNARTALALQSTLRDIPTCWRRDWLQTAGRTDLNQKFARGAAQKRKTNHALLEVFHCRDSLKKEFIISSSWPETPPQNPDGRWEHPKL